MWQLLKVNFIGPALRRLGTVGATALVVGGHTLCDEYHICGLVTDDGATQVMVWVVATALILMDFAFAAVTREKK